MTTAELRATARRLIEDYERVVAHREELAARNPGYRLNVTPFEEEVGRRAELARAYLALTESRCSACGSLLTDPLGRMLAAFESDDVVD